MKQNIGKGKSLINGIITGGLDQSDIEAMRKIKMINIMSIIAMAILIPLGSVDLIQGNYTVGLFVLVISAILLCSQYYLRKSGNYVVPIYCGVSIVALYFLYALATGGVNNTGHLWYFTFPVFALFLLGTRKGLLATVLLLSVSLGFFFYDPRSPLFAVYSTDFKIRFVLSYMVIVLFSYLFEDLRKKSQRTLTLANVELKESKQKLQQAHDELDLRVKERTAELRKVNQQLERDIEERKRFENALRESEERYRILSEESPVGIALIDQEGSYTYINPKFTEIFGYTYEDIQKGRDWFRKAYPDTEYRDNAISTWINDQKEYRTEEARPRTFTVTCKDGEERTIHSKPVMMKSGDQLVIYEDVTEKQRLEAQLQRAKTMETLGTLAGGVAHDLNNILSGLVSYPDLLLMQLPEDSPLRKPLSTIQNSGQKAAAIVEDLLTLARRGVPTMEAVDLNEIIGEYLKSPEFEKLRSFHPKVAITTELGGDLLTISGSRVHLIKTAMNLVSNAAEAIKESGTITLSTENRYIDTPVSGYDQVAEGDYVVLSVSDTGVGIPSEDLDRIFEPFYTKKVMGRSGTGLGMAVVWGTVKDHKGYISIESNEGQGTTFTLYFPATRDDRDRGKPLVSVDEYRGRGESIVVVDDVKEQRDIASTMLSELGYSVTSVSSGEEAIQYLKDHQADLLILDMIMDPGIDGLETYRRILELHPKQKAIIASGFSETDRVKEAQRLGAGQYVRKPYTMQKIGVAVRQELEG
jgi:two-component system cell cycle sensor histidine kinase/response regulator CckA